MIDSHSSINIFVNIIETYYKNIYKHKQKHTKGKKNVYETQAPTYLMRTA